MSFELDTHIKQQLRNAKAFGILDYIERLEKENKQLQTRFHIVPEHYLTEALDKCKELEEKVKGFESGNVAWQGDMDATIKQNIELKAQIEKMKCCGNCKFYYKLDWEPDENIDSDEIECYSCLSFSEWSLKTE